MAFDGVRPISDREESPTQGSCPFVAQGDDATLRRVRHRGSFRLARIQDPVLAVERGGLPVGQRRVVVGPTGPRFVEVLVRVVELQLRLQVVLILLPGFLPRIGHQRLSLVDHDRFLEGVALLLEAGQLLPFALGQGEVGGGVLDLVPQAELAGFDQGRVADQRVGLVEVLLDAELEILAVLACSWRKTAWLSWMTASAIAAEPFLLISPTR